MTPGKTKIGIIGCGILLIALFMLLTFYVVILTGTTYPRAWNSIERMVYVLFYMGVLLISLGTIGLRHFKSSFPLLPAVVGSVAAIIGLASVSVAFLKPWIGGFPAGFLDGPALIVDMDIAALILIGVFFILLGVTFITLRDKIDHSRLLSSAGGLAITAGALVCSVLLFLIALIVLIPTVIYMMLSFNKAEKSMQGESVKFT